MTTNTRNNWTFLPDEDMEATWSEIEDLMVELTGQKPNKSDIMREAVRRALTTGEVSLRENLEKIKRLP